MREIPKALLCGALVATVVACAGPTAPVGRTGDADRSPGPSDTADARTGAPSAPSPAPSAGEPTRTKTGAADPFSSPPAKRPRKGVGWPGLRLPDAAPETASPRPRPSATPRPSLSRPSLFPQTGGSSEWYAALAERDCPEVKARGLEEQRATLVRGLRAVCPVVRPGRDPDWPAAEAAYRALSRTGGVRNADCPEEAGYRLLKVLVTAHAHDPDVDFYVAEDHPETVVCTASR